MLRKSKPFIVCILLNVGWCDGFIPFPPTQIKAIELEKAFSNSKLSAYRDGTDLSSVGGSHSSDDDEVETAPKRIASRLMVPLIGPIPLACPLAMGSEMALDPPTPFQWKALDEAVVVHRKYVKRDGKDEEGYDGTTAIYGAPLVAVIDDVTGKAKSPAKGRYATLAAVVGISSSSSDDEQSFMESFDSTEGKVLPNSSRVRLIGVGRAMLRDFFYKLPTDLSNEETKYEEDNDDDDDEGSLDDDEDEADTPIIMTEFDLILDDGIFSTADSSQLGTKGARSTHVSPVHTLAALNQLKNKITWLHENRKKLVAGLTAANVRLNLALKKKTLAFDLDDDLDDHDGLGLLGGWFSSDLGDVDDEAEEGQVMIDELLTAKTGKKQQVGDSLPDQPSLAQTVAAMDNYGLNTYSAFSTLPALTVVAMDTFKPYYSELHREREEFEYEVFSFVAFRALEGFVSQEELAWALRCTCTMERMERVYEIMMDHEILLKKLSEEVSDDLRDCGEECTDLW